MRAEAWAALGTWATVAVAVATAIFALRQVREMRLTRERQTQPNVVAFVRPNAKAHQLLDFVVANYGLTPAYHIKLFFEPLTVSPYQGISGPVTSLHLPKEIAVLAPGQEWQTMWDAATARYPKRDELGSCFEGLVTFKDSRGNRFENPAILDWDTHFDTIFVADNPSESARAITDKLADITGVLKSYQNEHDGIWVYPVRGDQERQYRIEESAQRRARIEELRRKTGLDRLTARPGERTPEPPPAPPDATPADPETEADQSTN